MNGREQNKLKCVLLIIGAVLFIVVLYRLMIIIPDLSNDKRCRLEYGESWKYEYNNDFGKTCVELDYVSLGVINRTKLNLTYSEAVKKYCDMPGFFELSKWDNGCIDG